MSVTADTFTASPAQETPSLGTRTVIPPLPEKGHLTMSVDTTVPEVFEASQWADLERRAAVTTLTVSGLTHDRLSEIARHLRLQDFSPATPPVLKLTAREPYDNAAGRIDVYRPGRWDTEIDLVFMSPIVTGQSPGEWEGTVAYAKFTAPTTGSFLVACNFSGYKITMAMHGPWGHNTAYCATPQDSSAVTALWNGVAGESLYFTASCTGTGVGYLESIQAFPL